MEPTKRTARTVGLCYLAIIFGGIFYLRYVPVSLFDRDHLAATVQNLNSHLTLFRLAIAVEILTNLFYLLMALTLYRLFQHIHRNWAILLVIFVTVSVIMDFVNLQNRLAILSLVETAPAFKTFSPAVIQDQVLLYLNVYRSGIRSNEIFWGLWLFPLGYLSFKSGVIPKIIGVLLMIGCFAYLADFAGSFFFKGYNDLAITNYTIMPASLGELAICLWLLIVGVRERHRPFAIN